MVSSAIDSHDITNLQVKEEPTSSQPAAVSGEMAAAEVFAVKIAEEVDEESNDDMPKTDFLMKKKDCGTLLLKEKYQLQLLDSKNQ